MMYFLGVPLGNYLRCLGLISFIISRYGVFVKLPYSCFRVFGQKHTTDENPLRFGGLHVSLESR